MAMPPPPPMSHSRLEEGLRPGGPPPSEEVPLFVVCMNMISTVTHILLGTVAIAAFICINLLSYVIDLPSITAHVYLTVIGYVLLLSQTILSLNPQTGWASNFKYPQKTKIYWLVQVLGSALALIGGAMGIVAVDKASNIVIPIFPPIQVQDPHLATRHHIVGFVAMLLTSVSLVGGLVHLICTNMVNNSFFKAIYAVVSTLTLVIAYVAIILAIEMFRDVILDTNTNLVISFTVLSLVGMFTMIIANFVAGGKLVI